MKKYFQSMLLMFQFITRIPIKLNLPCDEKAFRRGTIFFPVVGVVIGLLQFGLAMLLAKVLPVLLVAMITMLLGIVLTGGFHMDGLGDTFDGFFSNKDKERIIEIMKDSRIGTFSGIALICDILFKTFAIYFLIVEGHSLGIVLAPVVSRFCMTLAFKIGKSAKKGGLGNLFIGNIGMVEFAISFVITACIGVFTVGWQMTAWTIGLSAIATVAFNFYCVSKIDGMTGDTIGAVNEIVEVLVLVVGTSILW